jgi:RHS repeat-associated protein
MSRLKISVWTSFLWAASLAALLLSSPRAEAKYIGGDPPSCPACAQCPTCATCTACLSRLGSSRDSAVSLTEGNATEAYPVTSLTSSTGPTLGLSLFYNSYNADGSRAEVDTGIGYGWTHTYNSFLFSQAPDMFRMDGAGRVTRYARGSGGAFQTSPGYFETLKQNLDGTFTITTKNKTLYHYISVPNTPFLVGGPVYRLDTITDRIGNVTKMTYTSGGDLASTSDTYGRTITYSYNGNHHLTAVTDPLGRTTTFAYDSTGRQLLSLTDPNGRTTQYTYNTLYQITKKTDGDGRTFSYSYANLLPAADRDANSGLIYSFTNPSNWATDPTQLALNRMRVYVPSTTSRTDGRGNLWTYTYDNHGFPTSIKAPDGSTTTYTYDPTTLMMASQTDANGHTTTYTYDMQGNMLTQTDALGHTTAYTYEPVFNQMTSMTDPNSRVTTYTYDSLGNRTSESDPLGNTQTWSYDTHGNVLTSTDKRGATTIYAYDADGDLIQTTDPLGYVTTFAYDAAGNRISMTDARGNETQYQYDGLNRLVETIDALHGITTSAYDDAGNVLQTTDPNGHTTAYQYDYRSRRTKTTDPLGKSTTYAYDGDNNTTSTTDRNGHTTTYAYDTLNRLTRTTDALGHTTATAYDAVGNAVSTADANGHVTTYMYDALNRRTEKQDALGEVTTWAYDLTGLPGCASCTGPTLGSTHIAEQTDANGKVIYYAYDGLDRLVREIHKQGGTAYAITASDAVTSTGYDAMSNRIFMTEPDGNTTTYAYDPLNREIQMVNAAGDTTTTAYDPVGNVLTLTTPNSNITTYTYDALNRRVKESDLQGTVSTTAYDAVGNVLSQVDGNGNGPSYAYDADNRDVTVTDALGKPTRYSYDNVGKLLAATDRNGNTTSYTYDAVNRRLTITDAQPATTQFQYDAVGNLIDLTDANGHSTTYTYDAVNRKIVEVYPDASHNTVTYAYDSVGNRISRTDQKGQVTTYTYSDLYFLTSRVYPSAVNDSFTYDLSGRVLSATRGGWTDTFSYDGANRVLQTVQGGRTISYSYNVPGRTRTVVYPSGRTITEQLDYRSQLSAVNDGGATAIAEYTYDPAERVVSRVYRNNTTASYTYNANNWIVALNHTGASTIAGFNYSFDNEGNKSFEQKVYNAGDSEAYGYDSVNRLINYEVGALVGSSIPSPSTQTAYSLDLLGNWNSKTTNGVAQARTHSPSNEIASFAYPPSPATAVLSDFDGNTGNDGTNVYFYDEENRLVQVAPVVGGPALGQYQYDALGRRVSTTDNFGVQTLFFYDGWRTIEEQSPASLTLATYIYGNYVDEALTMTRAGATFYYHQNSLWSVLALTDSTGEAVEGYSYDVYGYQTLVLPGSDGILWTADDDILPGATSFYGNPFLFTGQRYDPEAGLFYYRNRSYHPQFGRFLQRDPLDYGGEDMNLYEYVSGRPTFATDPMGTIRAEASAGLTHIPRYKITAWIEGDSPDNCTFKPSSVIADKKPEGAFTVTVGIITEDKAADTERAKSSCCCRDNKVECWRYYIHAAAVQGIGISVEKVAGVSGWLITAQHDHYMWLYICADSRTSAKLKSERTSGPPWDTVHQYVNANGNPKTVDYTFGTENTIDTKSTGVCEQ